MMGTCRTLGEEAVDTSERSFMEQAVAEAEKSVSEDARLHPKVGAVIVKNGVVRMTNHRGYPNPGDHAEFGALKQIPEDEDLTEATVYTTLEPCTKRGGDNYECAGWLIRRRVKRVVIGILDPNPVIYSTSYDRLRSAGIDVQVKFDLDLVHRIEDINRAWIREQQEKWAPRGTLRQSDAAQPPSVTTPTQAAPLSARPDTGGISQLAGWETIDTAYLSNLAELRDDEILRYFDGAVPTWRHAVSNAIPRRGKVQQLLGQLERARTKADACTLNVMLAAGGEGKSTLLRQVAVDAARTGKWAVLWRPHPKIQIVPQQAAQLDPSRAWLLVSDDAEDLVAGLHESARRLHEGGRCNVHLLVAARETDWKDARAESYNWASLLRRQPDVRLRGVSHEDAELVVNAWEARGGQGLKALASLSDQVERVRAFQRAVGDESTGRDEGSFFGGLLAVRLGPAGLRAHIRDLLGRLREIKIVASSCSLFDALLYVSACHGVGIPGIDENVLADLVQVPRNYLYNSVVQPLGDEAAAVRSAKHILTRHRSVAAAVLTEAITGFGVDLSEVWSNLVKQTVRTSRDVQVGRQSHPKIVHAGPMLQRSLPGEMPEQKRAETAISAALASVGAMHERMDVVTDLGKTYRAAGQLDQAVQVFRNNARSLVGKSDYLKNIRGYWYEWGVCEGIHDSTTGANAWLAGISLSDHLQPAPITLDQVKLSCAGLGVGFEKLARSGAEDVFGRARRAIVYLGQWTGQDSKGEFFFRKHDREAEALGAPKPESLDQAVTWLQVGVKSVWPMLNDNFLRDLARPMDVTFQGLHNVLDGPGRTNRST